MSINVETNIKLSEEENQRNNELKTKKWINYLILITGFNKVMIAVLFNFFVLN